MFPELKVFKMSKQTSLIHFYIFARILVKIVASDIHEKSGTNRKHATRKEIFLWRDFKGDTQAFNNAYRAGAFRIVKGKDNSEWVVEEEWEATDTRKAVTREEASGDLCIERKVIQ
jgi:hypothetical protein